MTAGRPTAACAVGDVVGMKMAITTIGALLFASSAQFGAEAVKIENQDRLPARIHFANWAEDQKNNLTVTLDPVPQEEIDEQLAELREEEGPPEAPADVPIEAVCDTLAAAAEANGLPTGFFARLIWQESKFKQRVVSPAGAQGVAQFMPAVAAERGLSNPFDPIEALPESAAFLKQHVEYFGNLGLAAAAYNGGARRVTDWLARRGKLPEETRNYVKIITGHEPEKWLNGKEVELAVNLPRNAPCDGVADLSRGASATMVAAPLEAPMARLLENARIASAKAAEKAKRRLAAAQAKKSKRVQLLAKGKGGNAKVAAVRSKSAKLPPKIASRVTSKRGYKLADTSAARR